MRQFRTWFTGSLIFNVIGLTIGCVDIEGPRPEPVAVHDVFAELHFTTNAMYTKRGDTLQLSLRAIAADGSSLPVDIRKVTWLSDDSIRVYVDTLGRIVGNDTTTSPIKVYGKYTNGLTTLRAEMLVYVTNDRLSASSLKMVALDSTRVGLGPVASMPRVRLDLYDGSSLVQAGVQLPVSVLTPFTVSYVPTGGPQQEPVYFVGNGGAGIGKFWVSSSVNLYGVEVADSLEFTGLYPLKVGLIPFSELADGTITGTDPTLDVRWIQQPCAIVLIWNLTQRPLDLAFSDSTASADECAPLSDGVLQTYRVPGFLLQVTVGGNVLDMPPNSMAIRQSRTQGVVSWHLRDALTKEWLPLSGQFHSIHVE